MTTDWKFWAECLEQALEEMDSTDLIIERAQELYSSGDNEHD